MSVPTPTNVYAFVTKPRAGLAFEAARELAALPETLKIYFACENEKDALAVIKKLACNTKREGVFECIHVKQGNKKESAKDLASQIKEEHIHGLWINKHGCSTVNTKLESGMTITADEKLLYPAILLDVLVAGGKIGDGSRVVVSGSESARGIESMGFPAPKLGNDADSFVKLLDGTGYDEPFDWKFAYGCTNAIGALYLASFARRHPSIYVATLSPGFSPDSIQPENAPDGDTLYGKMNCYFLWLLFPLLKYGGMAHYLNVGAKSFVHAMIGHKEWQFKSGAFVGYSPPQETTGTLVDQIDVPNGSIFGDEAMQELAWDAVRKFIK